jgi:cobalt-zinc-cadmium efflux system membrane fusion protein
MSSSGRAAAQILLATLLLVAACGRAPSAEQAPMVLEQKGVLVVPADSPLRSRLQVQPVGTAVALQGLAEPAVVEADPARTTNILAPLTGRVTALSVRLGDRVRRGQVLAVIASGDLAQANSDVEKAQDAYDLADKALARARGVQQAGGAAVKDLEGAQSAQVQARAELDRARTRLASLNGSASAGARELVLRAPSDGVVTALAISTGAQVSDPTATLMTVANLDRVFVTADIAEGDVGRVRPGAPADIALAASPGADIHGQVSEVDAVMQPDTRRQKVRIELDNAGGRLLPNMYATVTFRVPPAGAGGGVLVPQSALVMNNDAISVFIEVRPWVFQRRIVQLGEETDQAARVLSGVAPGDRVVVKGAVLLN